MAETSLLATAAKLGRTSGEVSLKALVDDGYTRTFAGDDYLVVNPFQVEAGQADDPSDPAYSLLAWDGYDHDVVPAGDDLGMTSGYGEGDLTWSRPPGYTRAPGVLDQRIYVKDTGETEIDATSLSVNPFDTPDQTDANNDGEAETVNLASYEGFVVAIGMRLEFDDSVTVFESADYDPAAGEDPLIGAGAGIGEEVWRSNPGPISVLQDTDPDSCQVGDPVDIDFDFDMKGSSTGRLEERINGGSWTLVDDAVAAGSSGATVQRDSDGDSYKFRLRYNDVSPDDWATQTGTTTPTCNLL